MAFHKPAPAFHPTSTNRQRSHFTTKQPMKEGAMHVQGSAQKTMLHFWISQNWFRLCKQEAAGSFLAEVPYNGTVIATRIKLKLGNWKEEGTRIAAIKFLVDEVLKKDPRKVTKADFEANRLSGILKYYNSSPYDALKAAGYDFHPWEMPYTRRGLLDDKQTRIAATTWLVRKKTMKQPAEMTAEDFASNNLGGMLSDHYNGSPFRALKEAGLIENP